jgi:hypothetical protein
MPLKTITNIVQYQCAWFASVLGAANQQPWLGLAVAAVVLALHLILAKDPLTEAKLIASVVLIGFSFDQMLLSSQLIDYQAHGWGESLVPAWILALWLTFATLLNVSLGWMRERLVIAALFGLIGGPLAYYGAQSLGAIAISSNTAYWVLGFGWAIVTPALLIIAKRFNGFYFTMRKAAS